MQYEPPEGDGGPSRALVSLELLFLAALVSLFVWKGLVPAWRVLNTDFPNYYLAGKLYRDGYSLERLYDWIWFQRQKDHAGIDQGVVGYGLLSPYSALVIAPISSLSPLDAKRSWLIFNLLLLVATIRLLRSMTRISIRRVAIIAFLTVIPLRTCFEFGQQHVLILFLLTLGAWLHVRRHELSSGAVLAIATVLKLYPALFAVFFVLKNKWRALTGLCITLAALLALGTRWCGLETLRIYATQVIPRSLAGEGTDPYYLGSNTLTTLLRRLFIAEPDLNPHPLIHAPAAYCVLQPAIQAFLLVSGLRLVTSQKQSARRLQLGGFVALAIVLSTASATYHFCALILSTSLGVDYLVKARRSRLGGVLLALHALVCAPLYRFFPEAPSGWAILLGVPRFYASLGYWSVFAVTLRWEAHPVPWRSRNGAAFAFAFLALTISGVVSNWRHFDGQFENYADRLPVATPAFIATAPAAASAEVYFSRTDDESYVLDRAGAGLLTSGPRGTDLFFPALAAGADAGWVEVSSLTSGIARFPLKGPSVPASALTIDVEDAEEPALSADGKWLGYIREGRGRGSLWVRPLRRRGSPIGPERLVVGATSEVLDFAFSPDGRIVFSKGVGAGGGIFAVNPASGQIVALPVSNRPARYPAVSADGRWLAYSLQERGSWQLHAMDLTTQVDHRLTHADCNSTMPAWAPDSTGLVYATDCGRGVGITALCRIRFSL